MKSLKYLLCILSLAAIVYLPGCVVVSGDPYAFDEIEIGVAPPPPPDVVVVTRPPRPSSVHVWIDGHFIADTGRWVWIEGHWVRPEHRGAVWIPPRTRRRGNHWGYRPGRWH
jgi:hypothetical protein